MAAFPGSDWDSYTGQARIDKLALYVAALRSAISSGDVSADGKSVSYSTLASMLEKAEKKLEELQQGPANLSSGGITTVRYGG